MIKIAMVTLMRRRAQEGSSAGDDNDVYGGAGGGGADADDDCDGDEDEVGDVVTIAGMKQTYTHCMHVMWPRLHSLHSRLRLADSEVKLH